MESTSRSENNIPMPNITVVKEETDHANHEYIENRNQETGLSNQCCLQEQEHSELGELKEKKYWNGLHVFMILGICIAWTSTLTMIPTHNIFEHPEFWWENIFPRGLLFAINISLPLAWQVYLVFQRRHHRTTPVSPNIFRGIFHRVFHPLLVCVRCVDTVHGLQLSNALWKFSLRLHWVVQSTFHRLVWLSSCSTQSTRI